MEVLRIDGHNHSAITKAFEALPTSKNKPIVILADTIKGKGVSFMENSVLWLQIPSRGRI